MHGRMGTSANVVKCRSTFLALALAVIPATSHAQKVDTILAGSVRLSEWRSRDVAADTIERFFEQSGILSSANVFFVQSRHLLDAQDGSVYLVVNEFHDPRGGISFDSIALSVEGLRPLWNRVHSPTDSAAVRYDGATVRGWVAARGQPRRFVDAALDAPPFPSYRFLLGLLPLRVDLRATAPVYNMWTDEMTWTSIEVIRSEQIEWKGGVVDPWVVEVNLGDGRGPFVFWIDQGSGREVQQKQIYPDGRVVWQIRR